jgi:hypothetical protein
MPVYYFTVHDGRWHEDPDGTALDNDDAAHKEAVAIGRELAKGHDPGTKVYTIQVTEGDRLVWIIRWPPPLSAT